MLQFISPFLFSNSSFISEIHHGADAVVLHFTLCCDRLRPGEIKLALDLCAHINGFIKFFYRFLTSSLNKLKKLAASADLGGCFQMLHCSHIKCDFLKRLFFCCVYGTVSSFNAKPCYTCMNQWYRSCFTTTTIITHVWRRKGKMLPW